jgi:hypothetical protein
MCRPTNKENAKLTPTTTLPAVCANPYGLRARFIRARLSLRTNLASNFSRSRGSTSPAALEVLTACTSTLTRCSSAATAWAVPPLLAMASTSAARARIRRRLSLRASRQGRPGRLRDLRGPFEFHEPLEFHRPANIIVAPTPRRERQHWPAPTSLVNKRWVRRSPLSSARDFFRSAVNIPLRWGRRWRRRRDLDDHPAVNPPSTTSSAPVVKAASSLARNRMVRAISIGLASRPSGAAPA